MSEVSLKKFFAPLTRRAFAEVGISDARIVDYVADILSRFARTENLYRIKSSQGKSVETVVEMLAEAERCLELEALDPIREKDIRQHVGDFTLFMTGVFREYIVGRGTLGLYLREGELSYRLVADFHRLLYRPEAALFDRLSQEFERYAGSLNYLKKVYLQPETHIGPYYDILRRLSSWQD